MRRLVALLLLTTTACVHKPPVTQPPVIVQVPVVTHATPPPELTGPLTTTLPVFIDPRLPAASSALDTENERVLRALVNDLLARIIAWEAWAYDPANNTQPPIGK